MSRVFGVHRLALKPGVQEEDFERFLVEEFNPASKALESIGFRFYVLKGDRGDRTGRYMAFFEFESLERRNWVSPASGEFNPEYEQHSALHAVIPALDKMETFTVSLLDPTYTDYVEIA